MSQTKRPSNALREKLVSLFLEGEALRGNHFYTAVGESTYYVDVDRLWSRPEMLAELTEISAAFLRELSDVNRFDAIIGTDDMLDTFGALPVAVCVCYQLRKPLIVWKEYKVRLYRLFGRPKEIKRAIIFHDVSVGAEAILNAARAARENGIVVDEAFVLVDWERGAKEILRKAKITLNSFVTISHLVEAHKRNSLVGA
jgi:orotate phosphoribosyltransferase